MANLFITGHKLFYEMVKKNLYKINYICNFTPFSILLLKYCSRTILAKIQVGPFKKEIELHSRGKQ